MTVIDPAPAAAPRARRLRAVSARLRRLRSFQERLRRLRARPSDDTGAATAEYAITIMAAVGFAGLLVVILKSGEVQSMLTELVHRALTIAS